MRIFPKTIEDHIWNGTAIFLPFNDILIKRPLIYHTQMAVVT